MTLSENIERTYIAYQSSAQIRVLQTNLYNMCILQKLVLKNYIVQLENTQILYCTVREYLCLVL